MIRKRDIYAEDKRHGIIKIIRLASDKSKTANELDRSLF
jgi:hypothetical protein